MLTAFSKRCMQTKHILKISSKNKIAFFYTCMGNEHKKGQKKVTAIIRSLTFLESYCRFNSNLNIRFCTPRK